MTIRSRNPPRQFIAAFVLTVVATLAPATAAAADGWLYIHSYLSKQQLETRTGIAVAPFWFFDVSGGMVASDRSDGRQSPGRLVKVAPGDYYVVAGANNVGLTRVKYTVASQKVTVVKTGFVSVSTWNAEEQPKVDCSIWDAEMTAFVAPANGGGPGGAKWQPILSNPAFEVGTRDFGMLQLPVGNYRILWHGFNQDLEIREGKVYRLPLGTAGPLGDDLPKARLSVGKGDSADNPTLNVCADGPIHVIGGEYFLSYMQRLDVFPYEERVWTQIEVEANNKYGYVRTFKPDGIGKSVYRGEGSSPTPAFLAKLATPKRGAASQTDAARKKADALLGGDGGIDWDAPP